MADAISKKYEESDITPSDQYLAISAAIPTWMTEVEESYNGDAQCTKLL